MAAAQRAFRLPDAEPVGLSGQGPLRAARKIEVPHLGQLMAKIPAPCAPASERLTYAPPS